MTDGAAPPTAPGDRPVVVLAGNPNAGKTTLFNALTGARARTGNYPGVTVERRVGRARVPGARPALDVVDLPGTYSLTARSPEEQIAIDAILPTHGRSPAAILCVCDAGALARGLYLVLQLRETGLPLVVALNMMDEARAAGVTIDLDLLGRELGVDVVPVVARTGEGLDALRAALSRALAAPAPAPLALALPEALVADVAEVEGALSPLPADAPLGARRARALWALLSVGDGELVGVPLAVVSAVDAVRGRAAAAGRDLDAEIVGGRYAFIDRVVASTVRSTRATARSRTERIDAVLTHPVLGALVFLAVMAALFSALFSWSEPLVGAIEQAVAWVADQSRALFGPGPLADLVAEGIVAGVGNVVVFVPQIALLSLFVVVLEDSGYLARVAFVIDRVMGSVGLHGRAFVPLLSGFACAVPAVIATRTIESRRDRLLTMLALPLMSCSARLPVYTLVCAVVFPPESHTLGLQTGAVALFSMYLLSVVAALGAAAVMRRTVLRGPRPTMLLELPPYRLPTAGNVARATWERTREFVVSAGTMILAITIVLWALLSYPRDPAASARFEAARGEAEATLSGDSLAERLSSLDAEAAEARMSGSVAGTIGHVIEPALRPLGFDWKIGVGLIASFAAREVLVSTLGIVYGTGESDEGSEPLRARLRDARHPDGRPVFTPLVGVALMVFFVLAAQCMSTLAVVRRESGSWRWALFMLAYMNTLAYVAALLVYQGGLALGLG